MKVLLTGGEGYIGTVLGPLLLAAGHDVTVYDTGYHRVGWMYDGVDAAPRWRKLDTRLASPADLEGFDAVVHLADLSNDPVGELDPELTFDINHRSTVRFAEMAKAAGVERFVYSSSCSVYGASGADSDELASEEFPTAPITAYAKCKVLCEDDLRDMADDSFTPVFLRNATAFGASPRMRFDLVVNELTAQAWIDRRLILQSDGTPWRPFVHIRDISKAMICSIEADAAAVKAEVFNVGDSRANYQVRDICHIIGEEIPGCEVVLGEQGGDTRNYRVDFTKINSKLPGFSCDWDVRSGVVELRDILDRIAFDANLLDARNHRRLKQIQYLMETGQIDQKFFWTGDSGRGQAG
jgi:nucleoside-diphosphate-sugar epimerase